MNTALWSDADFRLVFNFLNDIHAALNDDVCMRECKELLRRECQEASRTLSRIADAVGAFGGLSSR